MRAVKKRGGQHDSKSLKAPLEPRNRVTVSSATCVFVLPNLLCSSVMQEALFILFEKRKMY